MPASGSRPRRSKRSARCCPSSVGKRRLRHVLDVRDPGFAGAGLVALARRHGFATVFTDSPEHPSFADLSTDFVYARLMRSQSGIASGYGPQALAQWVERARLWAAGGEPPELPRLAADPPPPASARDVFILFISAAKERNPAAAMAMIGMLRGRRG